jgi:hypothetical protein
VPLLVPLTIFLVLAITMIVVFTKTPVPTATETVEALCDAILRDDKKTQDDLMTSKSASTMAMHALSAVKDEHREVGASYHCRIVKAWDDADSSFETIAVPVSSDESILFTCRFVVNQWTITSISLDSPRARID